MMHGELRPLGEWLGGSFSRLKGRLGTLTLLFACGFFLLATSVVFVYVLGIAFVGFIQGWEAFSRLLDPRKLEYFLEESRDAFRLFGLLAGLVALRVYCKFLLAAVHASIEDGLGFRAALRKSRSRPYAFMALFVVLQVIFNVGFALLILPGLVLAVWLGFALWAFARDGAGPFESLGASASAVKGHFWGVLGRMLLLGIISGAMMIVPVIGWIVAPAWMMLAWADLYADLKAPLPQRTVPAPRPGLTGRVDTRVVRPAAGPV